MHEYNDIVRLEDRAEISYFLDFLSSEQREAVILRFGEQLSFGEIALLRLIRLQKKQSLQICAIVMLGSCICWGMSARILPWLYETSAVGVWIVTFLIFAMFFINEIHYIAEMRKEGKMYGIVA